MKKSYRFNFIPGVEFIEENGFYYTASDYPVWPKSHLTKVVIEGLAQYERVNDELETKLKNSKFTISVLNDRISSLEATLKQKDKEIEELTNEIANNPITKSPVPLSSASDCSDLYICIPDRITYGPIAGGFGMGLYVGDTLILVKGDKANEAIYERSSMTDRINKKLTDIINEKNSEIKVLSDQVTRLMDQLKEVMEGNSGCKSCLNGPEPRCDICGNTDCEHRAETEEKSETNLDKVLHDMFISALYTWLNEDTKED